jgi:hypothetical protein
MEISRWREPPEHESRGSRAPAWAPEPPQSWRRLGLGRGRNAAESNGMRSVPCCFAKRRAPRIGLGRNGGLATDQRNSRSAVSQPCAWKGSVLNGANLTGDWEVEKNAMSCTMRRPKSPPAGVLFNPASSATRVKLAPFRSVLESLKAETLCE